MLQASHWDLQTMRILKKWTRDNLQQKMNCTASYADTPGTKGGMAIYLDLIPPPHLFFSPISHGENLFLFGSTIFFESKEITLTAHEVAAGMVMGRSLGTNAMHLGTYVLSQDPRKKRTKIMSPWVSVISFSPLLTPLTSLCILSF